MDPVMLTIAGTCLIVGFMTGRTSKSASPPKVIAPIPFEEWFQHQLEKILVDTNLKPEHRIYEAQQFLQRQDELKKLYSSFFS
ncbi:MAG TPA: hypothetical protein P5280_02400 [Cyclobacteriaceae bacterium]|nr:hypothetical protein [Cyclobacteriaceae bacterium]